MRRSLSFTSFRIMGLFITSSLFLSCSTTVLEDELPLPPESHTISVSLTGFTITTSSMTLEGSTASAHTRAVTTEIPENLNRLSLSVFRGSPTEYDSTPIATFTQKRESPSAATHAGGATLGSDPDSDPTFGSISLTLAPGTYTFVCILNEAKAATDAALAAISPATITSPTAATIPGTGARDTYCIAQEVTITTATESISLAMGTRINARFKLTIQDEAPSDVKQLAIIINPDALEPTGGCLSINPSTGRATSATKYLGRKDVSGTISDTTIDIYIPEAATAPAPAPDQPFTTKVKLEGRTSSGTALYTRTLTDVPFLPNNITHATGRLFDPTTSPAGFTFTPSEWTTTALDF